MMHSFIDGSNKFNLICNSVATLCGLVGLDTLENNGVSCGGSGYRRQEGGVGDRQVG